MVTAIVLIQVEPGTVEPTAEELAALLGVADRISSIGMES